MDDRDKWRVRDKEIHVSNATLTETINQKEKKSN